MKKTVEILTGGYSKNRLGIWSFSRTIQTLVEVKIDKSFNSCYIKIFFFHIQYKVPYNKPTSSEIIHKMLLGHHLITHQFTSRSGNKTIKFKMDYHITTHTSNKTSPQLPPFLTNSVTWRHLRHAIITGAGVGHNQPTIAASCSTIFNGHYETQHNHKPWRRRRRGKMNQTTQKRTVSPP